MNLTPENIRQRIADAEANLPALEAALASANFAFIADPTTATAKAEAHQAVADARDDLDTLGSALAVAERIEAERLAKVQTELRVELAKRIRKESGKLAKAGP